MIRVLYCIISEWFWWQRNCDSIQQVFKCGCNGLSIWHSIWSDCVGVGSREFPIFHISRYLSQWQRVGQEWTVRYRILGGWFDERHMEHWVQFDGAGEVQFICGSEYDLLYGGRGKSFPIQLAGGAVCSQILCRKEDPIPNLKCWCWGNGQVGVFLKWACDVRICIQRKSWKLFIVCVKVFVSRDWSSWSVGGTLWVNRGWKS